MGDHGEHPDRECERGADDRGQRHRYAANDDVRAGAERAVQVWFAPSQRDHRELGEREGEQDAEREDAREKLDIVARDAGRITMPRR